MKTSPRSAEFVAHVTQCLERLGPVEVKRMFGGRGFYRDGVFFALVMHETLYLKTDERNRGDFDARGLEPFTFEKGGERVETSYRAAPAEALEDPQVMARWARRAYDAALRKAAGAGVGKRRKAQSKRP